MSQQTHTATFTFNGKYGRWVGYTIGYRLAKRLFFDDFDIEKSVTVELNEIENQLKGLVV